MKSVFNVNNWKHFLVAEIAACLLTLVCFGLDYSGIACM